MPATSSNLASYRLGLFFAITGAIAFAGKAIIIKLAYRYSVDPVSLITLRMAFALPFFIVLSLWAMRQTHAINNPLSLKDKWGVVGLGFIGYYLSSFVDFLGLQYITASLERLILYLSPTMVILLSWMLYKKPIKPIRMLAMVVSYSGVILVLGHEIQITGDAVVWGSFLVFLSAVLYAFYLVFSGQMVKRIGAMRLVGLASTAACIFTITQFFILNNTSNIVVPLPVIHLSILNALVCTVAPILLVMLAIEKIGAGLTSQVGMIGPLATIGMGVFILGEPFTAWLFAGTALVLGGVYLASKYGDA